jgi:alkanesulfonate monooxygenase SsuD/methylene tetrahydromethanopterin reductase-like flavin-dependent oxidoreductase (luciferase family)
MELRASVTQAVLTARDGKAVAPGGGQGDRPAALARRAPLTLVGSPDTIVKQLKAFHDKCGVGVVDLGFQQAGTTHREVMNEIALFGREVLPRIKAF